MMKGKSLVVILVVAVFGASAPAVELDVDLSADFLSKYIWRGQNLGNKMVVQPSATIAKDGFSYNFWGNMPLSDNDPAGNSFNFSEVDHTFDYSGECEAVGYSAGLILYTFPTGAGVASPGSTVEAYVSASLDAPLSPSIAFYRELRTHDGWYINGSIGHSVDLGEYLDGVDGAALDLGASLGWGDDKYNNAWLAGTPGQSINDLVLSASLPIDICGVTVVPQVSYVSLLEGKVRRGNGAGALGNDHIVGGIGVSAAF